MGQSGWAPVIFLFAILCSYSVYYNIYHGSVDPFQTILQDPRGIDDTTHKLEVCTALRDRLLNVHKVGFVPANSPVHKYWDELNCLAMNLPPIGGPAVAVVPSAEDMGLPEAKPEPEPEKNINNGFFKLPMLNKEKVAFDVSLSEVESLEKGSAEAREKCVKWMKDESVEIGVSWGSLSEELQQHWKRLGCDELVGDDDDAAALPAKPVISKDSVDKQIQDGLKESNNGGSKSATSKTCRDMKTRFDVVPGKSWGSMDEDAQVQWSSLHCDKFFTATELKNEEESLKRELDENMRKKGKKKNRDSFSDKDWCIEMKRTYKVVPMQSWGHLPMNMMETWKSKHCDVVFTKLRMNSNKISKCKPVDASTKLPLIAIMAGTTSRKMKDPNIQMMSLFTYLFPSLIRSLDCGFDYMFVIGYDKGDKFYDNNEGQKKVKDWFEQNVQNVLKDNGMKITLLPVKINNSIKKPGPVFNGMARAAYDAGVDYFYRINDDTEIAGHWPRVFVNALHSLPAPYGVVGPTCKQGNQGILTHDFVHRVHMEIFEMNYYPPELVDWWMDDWISVVYGFKRTYEAKQSPVVHHTGAHGQRYEVDRDNFKRLAGLVMDGRQKIKKWMLKHNASAEQLREFENDNFSFKRRQPAPSIEELEEE